MNDPRPVILAASIQAHIDELASLIASHDSNLVAPIMEQILVRVAEGSKRRRQTDLYWIADEALRRASRRQGNVVASDR
jgi:hypothetical protein